MATNLILLVACVHLAPAQAAVDLKVRDGKIRVASAGYLCEITNNSGVNKALGNFAADHIGLALGRSSRFEVFERARLPEVMNEARLQKLFGDPRESRKLGKIFGVDYLIYGKVLTASCPVIRNVTKQRKKYQTSYSAVGTVSIMHCLTDVSTGKIILQKQISGNASSSASPLEPSADALLQQASRQSADQFVKLLVPDGIQGSVTEILSDGQVMINLGSSDGVGTDTDLQFIRSVPVLNNMGKPVMNGKWPVTQEENIAPAHKAKDHCVARPFKIEKNYCIADVGYNSRGGGWGGKKFKKSADHFTVIKKGDKVKLQARPEEVN